MIELIMDCSWSYRSIGPTVTGVRTGDPLVQVRRLDHVALRRADPEAAAAWSVSALGLERRFENAFGSSSPVTVGAGECCLSLFAGDAPSFEHLAFEVAIGELDVIAALLRQRGITHRSAEHGIARSLYLTDPDGQVVELTAYIEETP
jgi:catechol 2,3-dioxygenase-like lactoylglutathione lyase family enzyme